MKLLAKPKLELVGKTLMDLVKVVVVAGGLFTVSSLKARLICGMILGILFVGGWLVYPADKE